MIVIDDMPISQAMTFSGGEEHVKLAEANPDGFFTVRKPTSQNMIRLLMAVDATKRAGLVLGTLHMPYFPGARQDRVDPSYTPLAVKVYADMVNALKFNSVEIWDPHSDVVTALIDNVRAKQHKDWFKPMLEDRKMLGPFTFLFPDAGAAKKYGSQYSDLGKVMYCSKSRDTITGKLSNFHIPDLRGREETYIWIIDDICDGGGTFNAIADLVNNHIEADFLGLAVTHGIFSQGLDNLSKKFDVIATTNSISDQTYDKVGSCQIWQQEIIRK